MRKQYHFWPGTSGMDAWDVDRLIALTADMMPEPVPVAEISEIDSVYWFDEWQRPTVRRVVEHFRLMAEADLSYPIILGPDGRVMDGMHRVARALAEHREVVYAFRFSVLPSADYLNCRPEDLPYDR